MSTKFSSLSKVQKPPAVCKQQPPPLAVPPPDFTDRFFQGFASVRLIDLSGLIQVAGPLTMLPLPMDNVWEGVYIATIHTINLEMVRNLPQETYDWTLTLWRGPNPVRIWSLSDVEPLTPDPLNSSLLDFAPLEPNTSVFARVYT